MRPFRDKMEKGATSDATGPTTDRVPSPRWNTVLALLAPQGRTVILHRRKVATPGAMGLLAR